jgi:endonuclease/exonuclease/phosphatase family metal-dependent hydrolase
MEHPKRRPVFALLAIILLFWLYRVFAVYTVRSGECRPNAVDPNLRVATRTENGTVVTFPMRVAYPKQQRPLVVMTYNIAGHDELLDGDHIRKIGAVINRVKPDLVALQEVHRKTWQSRFRDQLAELQAITGMHGAFEPAYVQGHGEFGNAFLTRGTVVSATLHPLPSIGEPRIVIDAVVNIDGANINFYVTHLSTWASLNRKIRREQLACLARHVRTSRWPYMLCGDLNAGQDAPEIAEFRKLNAAQLCGENIGPTHPTMNKRIDYIFADYGWEVRSARALAIGPSDHYPAIAELLWERTAR